MSEAPNIVIPRHHQSAPKKHWAETEIEKAVDEIEAKGTGMLERSKDQQGEDFFDYGETQLISMHPRVIEAMRRLESEMEESGNPETLDKQEMLYEMSLLAAQGNYWDGQNRWQGAENEAMRIGKVMTPFEFIEKLQTVIGGKVWLAPFAVLKRVALLTNVVTELTETCEAYDQDAIDRRVTGQPESKLVSPTGRRVTSTGKRVFRVGTLQYPCSTEWMVMKFDDYGVPVQAKYLGWRTALLSLIKLNLLTEKQAHTAFPLTEGPAAEWYRQQLFMHRNQTVGNA